MKTLAVAVAACLASACLPDTPPASQLRPTRATTAPRAPSAPRVTPGPTPSAADPLTPTVFLPAPDAPIPRRPGRLASQLVTVTGALRRSIGAWTRGGDPSRGRPPRDVVLQALYQQRIYQALARDVGLRRATVARLPRRLRGPARANALAGAKLVSLVTPIDRPSSFRTARPPAAGRLLRWFKEAELRFGVAWHILAAVMYVESKFGRVRSASTAGAQGPMQFLPGTWAAYGMGGDIHDTQDAILGAANYLRSSGAPGDYRGALYAYNRSWLYVDAILLYAGQMRRDPRNYYAYYNWQVFVLTTAGPKRLTGPGL